MCESLNVKPDQVTDNASFTSDLGADELDFVELVMEMEENYGVAIENDDAENADTFGKLVDLVHRLTGGRDGE